MPQIPPPLPKRQPQMAHIPPAKAGASEASARPVSPDYLMALPTAEEAQWLRDAPGALAPRGLNLSLGFIHPLAPTPQKPAAAPPRFAVPPQTSLQHGHANGQTPVPRPATPPYPAGSGTQQQTVLTGQMSHDVLAAAQQMEAQNYSFVSATPQPPFKTAVLFEQNPHTFQVLMGPSEALCGAKTAAMAQAGWTYFGRRSEGLFNQVLIYTR